MVVVGGDWGGGWEWYFVVVAATVVVEVVVIEVVETTAIVMALGVMVVAGVGGQSVSDKGCPGRHCGRQNERVLQLEGCKI